MSPIITVGIDARWARAGAVDWALHEASLCSGRVRAYHVIDMPSAAAPYLRAEDVDLASKRLASEVADHLGRTGWTGHTVGLLTGRPAEALARAADGSRLLVVGRRGQGFVGRLLIGSTAEDVAHEALVPVVVVPQEWSPGDLSAPIVVGVDAAGRNEAAVALAVELAAERDCPVRLVYVWDVEGIYTWDLTPVSGTLEEWRTHHQELLDRVVDQWSTKYPGVTFETECRRGHPVIGLLCAADQVDAQLIVVGGRNHGRMVSMLLGSTARGVLHHATRPLAIVHDRGTPAP